MKKFLSTVLAFVLLSSPVTSILNLSIKALPGWQRITDDEFAAEHNSINTILSTGGGIIWATRDQIFMVPNEGEMSIEGNIFDGGYDLRNLVFTGPLLAATTTNNTTDKLWLSNAPGNWEDGSSIFNEIENFKSIEYMYSVLFGDIGLIFHITTDDSETVNSAYYTYDGSNLVLMADQSDFSDINSQGQYIKTEKIVGEGPILMLMRDAQTEQYFLYTFATEDPELIYTFDSDYRVTDITFFNESLYAYIYNNSNEESGLFKFNGETWTGVGSNIFTTEEFTGVLVATEDYLYLGTSRYDIGYARLFSIDAEDNLVELSDHVGDISEIEGENNSYITAISSANNFIFVGAGWPGEGPYNASLWAYGEFGEEDLDTDSDGVLDSIEDSAPNNGDANNDTIADSNQANVKSFINPLTDNYVSLEVSCDQITSAIIQGEDNLTSDNAFDYPVGLIDFTLSCNVGETATITQYFYGDYNASLFVARKYNLENQTYTNISSADVYNTSIGGTSALVVEYQVTDGGDLDQDGEENGIIVDPAGPALNSVLSPNTGIGGLK